MFHFLDLELKQSLQIICDLPRVSIQLSSTAKSRRNSQQLSQSQFSTKVVRLRPTSKFSTSSWPYQITSKFVAKQCHHFRALEGMLRFRFQPINVLKPRLMPQGGLKTPSPDLATSLYELTYLVSLVGLFVIIFPTVTHQPPLCRKYTLDMHIFFKKIYNKLKLFDILQNNAMGTVPSLSESWKGCAKSSLSA